GPVPDVNAVDRGQHRRDERRGGEWGRESERNRRAAARLTEAGGDRVASARPHPHLVEALGGRVEPRTAEPAEQLLRPVAEEEAAHRCPERQPSDVHLVPPLGRCLRRIIAYSTLA